MKSKIHEYLKKIIKTMSKRIIQLSQKLKTVFGNKCQKQNPRHYEQLEKENKLVLSYLTVRKLIGVLGFLLPFILILGTFQFGGCCEIQPSISDYYHTNMRDVFIAYMGSLSIFLLSYRGYDLTDRIVSALAGIFGLTLALFPTWLDVDPLTGELRPCNIWCNVNPPYAIGYIHLIAAGLFILSLAISSLFLFTKGETSPTPQKLIRNKIYTISGYIMLGCLALLILYFALPDSITESLQWLKPVFWLETIAFLAFGFAWLVKGEFLLKDQ